MKKKSGKNSKKQESEINIKNRDGQVIVAGRDVTITETTTSQDISFKEVFQKIEIQPNLSPTEKKDLKAEVAEVEKSIKKQPIDENNLTRHLRNIGRMAPDILEVVLAILVSPAVGLGKVAEKIAAKVREK